MLDESKNVTNPLDNEDNKDFEFADTYSEEEISEKDFELVNADKEVHEQKFQTKPTTFLKDSLKRFSKNKSSVVAAFILGFLILLSIVVPIAVPYNVGEGGLGDETFNNLEPKLFNNANGFWDGTIKKTHIPVDSSKSDDPAEWWPDETYYKKSGITNKVCTDLEYTNTPSIFGREGYVQVGYYGSAYAIDYASFRTKNISNLDYATEKNSFKLDLSTNTITLDIFDTVDEVKMRKYEEGSKGGSELVFPENFHLGNVSLNFIYFDEDDNEISVEIVSPRQVQNIGCTLPGYDNPGPVDVSGIIVSKTGETSFEQALFEVKVEAASEEVAKNNICSLIRSIKFSVNDNAPKEMKNYFEVKNGTITGISFVDPMELINRSKNTVGFWKTEDYTRYCCTIYNAKCAYADFNYDTYEGALGKKVMKIKSQELERYRDAGWIDFDIVITGTDGNLAVDRTLFELTGVTILDSSRCPVVYSDEEAGIVFNYEDIVPIKIVGGNATYEVKVTILYYRYLGYEKMPTFLFGTDKVGKDMFKYVFDGLKWSLLLGLATFVICFLFGLLWGSVSGYFGGVVDLIMERFTDILAGIPWIVVMTLVVLKTDQSNFGTFLLALCLTGWIGTASVTRTQFYRFRGREYVLASRTLGASDARLISKHILPNAMGTIITSAVLMIPSVIFSEATISYLGLGFKNMSSLGVILSNNQAELTNHPYQLIFPSIVIALVMISFNLFGNGLRDAINPSLKGEEE